MAQTVRGGRCNWPITAHKLAHDGQLMAHKLADNRSNLPGTIWAHAFSKLAQPGQIWHTLKSGWPNWPKLRPKTLAHR